MKLDEQCCENCLYARRPPPPWQDRRRRCHRHAPQSFNAFCFYIGELLRAIGWALSVQANVTPKEDDRGDDLNVEATEAGCYADWPEVEPEDWCGDWKERGAQ